MKINCDQVSNILNSIERYEQIIKLLPERSVKFKKMLKSATLLEIMEILDLEFEDNLAAGNAIYELTDFNELRGIV